MTERITTIEALLERVLSPSTPRLDDARAVVGDAKSADDAWEACLAEELIPMSWASDEKRVFGSWVNTISNVPPSTEAVLRVAANAEAMLAAEVLARSAMRASAPWADRESPSAESVIEWRFFSYGQRGSFDLDTIDRVPRALGELHDASLAEHRGALDDVFRDSRAVRWDRLVPKDQSLAPTFFRALRTLTREQQWAVLASLKANVFVRAKSSSRARAVASGDRFDLLPNPWASRAALWELGFVLLDAGRDRIVLLSSSVP
ncbi:MAG: hypothetical protein JNK05_07170 [Myxococcales bacterium]|nr:hypothetical protein [Myxococcales bacterium]